jgi:hypothetical protein
VNVLQVTIKYEHSGFGQQNVNRIVTEGFICTEVRVFLLFCTGLKLDLKLEGKTGLEDVGD